MPMAIALCVLARPVSIIMSHNPSREQAGRLLGSMELDIFDGIGISLLDF
jgi:hypothetical protein